MEVDSLQVLDLQIKAKVRVTLQHQTSSQQEEITRAQPLEDSQEVEEPTSLEAQEREQETRTTQRSRCQKRLRTRTRRRREDTAGVVSTSREVTSQSQKVTTEEEISEIIPPHRPLVDPEEVIGEDIEEEEVEATGIEETETEIEEVEAVEDTEEEEVEEVLT